MNFNWRNYLTIAYELCEQNNTEAHFRIAISRAYYAVFNVLRLKAGYHNKKDVSHQDFIAALKIPNDRLIVGLNIEEENIYIIGVKLDNLRKERNFADYDGLERFDQNRTAKSLEKAKEILEFFD